MDTELPRKVLLIDNNEVVRLFFRDVFWLHGLDEKFKLELADSLESARKIMRDPVTRPDIIFLELLMPAMKDGHQVTSHQSGLEFLEEVRNTPEWKGVKVIIFCGDKTPALEKETKRLGVAMYLEKKEHLPQDIVDLMGKL